MICFLDLDVPQLNISSNQTLNENSSFAISCSSAASPAASYRWISNSGKTVSNTAVLSFAMIKRENAGLYHCNATNDVGYQVSTNHNLVVNCK